jgi:hypothetical protein
MHYWDGQPVRFVCCERRKHVLDDEEREGDPWGKMFWCVSIELAEDDDSQELSDSAGKTLDSNDIEISAHSILE